MIRSLLVLMCLSTCCCIPRQQLCLIRDHDQTFDFTDTELTWKKDQSSLVVSFCPNKTEDACSGSKICIKLHNMTSGEVIGMAKPPDLHWSSQHLTINTSFVNERQIQIRLTCGKEETSPKFRMTDSLIMASKENLGACPVSYSTSCVLQTENQKLVQTYSERNERNASFRFNLKPLLNIGNLTTEEGSLTICGPSTFNNCSPGSTCSNSKDQILAAPRLKLIKDLFSVEYLIDGKDKVAEVVLNCSPFDTTPSLSLMSRNKFYHYSMNTSYICPPLETKCLVELGNQFYVDLTPLKNAHFQYKEMSVLLNPCGTLEPHGPHCGGSSRSLCLTKGKIEEGFIIKSQTMNRTDSGDIFIQFEGRNSTFEMTLTCSVSQELTVDESDPRTLKGKLLTPVACPKKVASGEECKLDLENGEKYNFNGLQNSIYNTTVGNMTVLFGLCTTKYNFCHKTDRSFVCFTNLTRPYYSDGEITFSTVGSKCNNNLTISSLTVHMICDYSIADPILFPRQKGPDECQFDIEMISKEACGSLETPWKNQCPSDNVESENILRTLTSLGRDRRNYRVAIPYTESEIFINMCHTLVPEKGMICDRRSHVCLVNLTEPLVSQRALSYGDVVKVSKENDSYIVHYTVGDMCHELSTPRTTKLIIKCSKNNTDSPIFVSNERCVLTLEWSTILGCIEKDVMPQTTSSSTTVSTTTASSTTTTTTTSPGTQCEFELPNGVKLNFADFSGLANDTCRNFCQSGQIICDVPGLNLKLSRGPEYIHGVILLEFIETSVPNGRMNVIEFVCSNVAQPFTVLRGNKTVTKWETPQLCTKPVSVCSRLNETLLDSIKGVHRAVYKNQIFYISLCSPVPPLEDKYCPGEASACEVDHNLKTEAIGYLSTLTVSNDDKTFTYEGPACSKKLGANVTTKVNLICDKSLQKPQLKLIKMDKCNYSFKLETSVVCFEVSTEVNHAIDPSANLGSFTDPVKTSEGPSAATIFGSVLGGISTTLVSVGIGIFALRRSRFRFLIRQRLDSVRTSDETPLTQSEL